MRHCHIAPGTCRPHTIVRFASMLLALLLGMLTRLEAQVSLGIGASAQRVSHRNWDLGLFGASFDLAVHTSHRTNLIVGVQTLAHDEDLGVDPVHFGTAEIGLQYVASRGKPLHLTIGFQAGGYLLSEYDATFGGSIFSLNARLSLHPVESVGFYVAPVGRAFAGERGGLTYGVSFGALLGTNH